MFRFYCLISILYCYIYAHAVPAYPYKISVKTDNDKDISIFLKGDEYQKFAITEDGYTILNDSDGWWYAEPADSVSIRKSYHKLAAIEDESIELKKFKDTVPKYLTPNRITRKQLKSISSNTISRQSLTGERRALVILMQYKDLAFKKSNEDFFALFNEQNYHRNGAAGSVRDYYRFASQGQLDYISDIYGPYTTEQSMKYYGVNSLNGSDLNPLKLCTEAIQNLPKDLDLSIYDNNDDGLIDNVHIIFAGYGEESGASSDAIWAHEYPHKITIGYETKYSFAGYSCSPELRNNHGDNITNIGVICHELGHALGACDYYDTNYGISGEYDGTGEWDIMASGSWNDNGRTPPNFNPYVRSSVFGWNTQIVLEPYQHISMPQMEIGNHEHSIIYRIDTECNGDYFLLENRQKHLFDAALPGCGLIIYHVHSDIEKFKLTNSINSTHPQGLYPVCASYSEPSLKNYGNINSAECPFPGSKCITLFSPTTSPAAIAWDGSKAKISISHITQNTSSGSISFITNDSFIDNPDTTNIEVKKEIIYKESFESGVNDIMTISSISGKDLWSTYKKGNFTINPELIPAPTDGDKIMMLFSGKGNTISESEAVSEDIEVNIGTNYSFAFDICCNTISSSIPKIDISIIDEYGEYNIYSNKNIINTWETISIPLTFASDKFSYKLYGAIGSGGIYIDNIRLTTNKPLLSISHTNISLKEKYNGYIYSLSGILLGHTSKSRDNISPGLYFIINDTGVYKLFLK